MAGSLIVGPYDLLDPTSSVRLWNDGSSLSFGASVPDTATVARLLTDGEVVTGARSSNRTVVLPVMVEGTRSEMAAAVAALAQTVDQPQWSITWTPDAGQPTVVFDCYRGSAVRASNPDQDDQGVTTVILTVPALPFTRDVTPTTLAPTAPTGGVSIATMDSTTGLVPALGVGSLAAPANSVTYDTPPPVLVEDTATFVSGTGSVQVVTFLQESELFQYSGTSGGVAYYTDSGTYYSIAAAVTIPLGAATDFTGQQNVYFSAKGDFTAYSYPSGYRVYVGGNVGDSDPLGDSGGSGLWVVTLIDSSGRRSSSGVVQSVTGSWARVYAPVQGAGVVADTGFDLTHVSSVRVRYYARVSAGTGTHATPELSSSADGSPTLVNLTNATIASGLTMQATAAGNAEGSYNYLSACTAGSTYAGQATVIAPTGAPVQFGLEWLNSSGTVLSTTWGTAGTTASTASGMTASGSFGDYEIVYTQQATVTATGTAPAGAVHVRPRMRRVSAAANDQTTLTDPHILAGTSPFRYGYGTAPTVTLWLDDVNAQPSGGGLELTTPYAVQQFVGIGGAARTPVSLAVNIAASGTAQRVLIARTPNPAGNFNPFLVTPTGSPTSTADATALTGKRYSISSGTTITYALPASSLNGTYAVLARIKNSGSTAATPTVTATLGSSTVSQTISKPYAASALSSSSWTLATIGALTLPPQQVSGANTAAVVNIAVTDTASSGTRYLDMLVLVDQSGEIILVDLPSGTAYPWFWLTAPGPNDFLGSILAGTAADMSDAVSVSPWLSGQPVINFDPGVNAVTVLLDQAASGGSVNLSYYRKWPGEAVAP